jgi:hypothetical protein
MLWKARGGRQEVVRLVLRARGALEKPLDANRVCEGEAMAAKSKQSRSRSIVGSRSIA